MLSGETVQIEFLEVDELEVKCWIIGHSCVGYMDNSNCSINLSHIGEKVFAIVASIDEKGRISLEQIY